MTNRFANAPKAFGFCDYCGFRFPLKKLKNLIVKTERVNYKVCAQCWTPDQPQLQLGMYPVADPQAVRDPRPDTNTWYVDSGSRNIQWGWAPVGGSKAFDDPLTPNWLASIGQVGTVQVSVT